MKKLLPVIILAIVIIAGCGGGDDTTKTNNSTSKDLAASGVTEKTTKNLALATPPSGPIVYKTLNGIDQKDAEAWILNFHNARTTNPNLKVEALSYFLNKEMVEKIVDLLNVEPNPTTTHTTDGIRFYLAKKTVGDPETMLLLVSTIDSANTQYTHHDNYRHATSPLYDATSDIKIRPEKKWSQAGAVLYTHCESCPDIEPSCANVVRIGSVPRSYAQSMVDEFNGRSMNTDGVWFPLQMFRDIIKQSAFNGIRVYLATYPDGKYSPSINEDYDGRNTFVLMSVDKTMKDDFVCDPQTAKFEIIGKKIIRYRRPWGGPAQNNGELCPDNCD